MEGKGRGRLKNLSRGLETRCPLASTNPMAPHVGLSSGYTFPNAAFSPHSTINPIPLLPSRHIVCTRDLRASITQLTISVDSCTPPPVPPAAAATAAQGPADASSPQGTSPSSSNETASTASSPLCSSCVWDVLGALTALYYRMSDGSAFFSTDSPDEVTEVRAESVSFHGAAPLRPPDSTAPQHHPSTCET